MRHARLVTLALTAALAAPATAAAQTVPSPFQFIETAQSAGLWVGYLNTDPGRYGTAPRSAPFLGTRYTIRLSGPLLGIAGVAAMPTNRDVMERVVRPDTVVLEPIGEADQLILMAEAGLRFNLTGMRTWHGFTPFAMGTLGAGGNVLRRPAVEDELESTQRVAFGPAFALGIGAGTDWFLNERFSLRFDARDYIWRLSVPEGLTGGRRESQWTHNVGITVGAALHF